MERRPVAVVDADVAVDRRDRARRPSGGDRPRARRCAHDGSPVHARFVDPRPARLPQRRHRCTRAATPAGVRARRRSRLRVADGERPPDRDRIPVLPLRGTARRRDRPRCVADPRRLGGNGVRRLVGRAATTVPAAWSGISRLHAERGMDRQVDPDRSGVVHGTQARHGAVHKAGFGRRGRGSRSADSSNLATGSSQTRLRSAGSRLPPSCCAPGSPIANC